MTLQSSGSISLSDINVELGNSSTQIISLNDNIVRTLLGVPSGTISIGDAYGKSNRVVINYIISSNSQQLSLSPTTFTNYVAGKSDITITVNSEVYVWSDSTSLAGLTINGGLNVGDTLKLVNNGYIIGKGGNGANILNYPNRSTVPSVGFSGGPALKLLTNITIDNYSYIAGGGGGGGAGTWPIYISGQMGGGGGGAGGGNGGNGGVAPPGTVRAGGAGGSIGNSGANGAATSTISGSGGGGGGRILPGTGGIANGGFPGASGGGAGGAGGGAINFLAGNGGSGNNAGSNSPREHIPGGGGGGWGASGGGGGFASGITVSSGGAGGNAINLNGYSVTYITVGNVWGAVS